MLYRCKIMLNPWAIYLLAVVISLIIVLIAPDKHQRLSETLAASILALAPLINSTIREREAPTLVTVKGFGLRWRILVLYGTLMVFVSLQVLGIITGAIIGEVSAVMYLSTPEAAELVPSVIVVVGLFWGCPFLFICGRWMGRRSMLQLSKSKGIFGVVAATVLAAVLSNILDFLAKALTAHTGTLPGITYRMQELRSEIPYYILIPIVLVVLAFATLPALFGYWRGRRQIIGAYMGYLLHKAPENTRETIVELAYEETMQERNPKMSTAQ